MSDSDMRRCIYCGRDKPVREFSLEHIWPEALGGKHCPDLFKTRHVCKKCNDRSGLFVDGAFIKSWFVQAELAMSVYQFMNPKKPTAAPLLYVGEVSEIPISQDEVCEQWQGLAGERIFHVHARDQDKWFGFAGGDVIRRKSDGGRAYIQLASPEPYWWLTALCSFRAHFSGAKRCCLTQIDGLEEVLRPLAPSQDEADVQQSIEASHIMALGKQKKPAHVGMRLDFSARFLFKLALGVGAQLFGSDFVGTPYAALLREAFLEPNMERRSKLGVQATAYTSSGTNSDIAKLLHFKGAWVLSLHACEEAFVIFVVSPMGSVMSVKVSDTPELWSARRFDCYREGQVFVVPAQGPCVGPVSMPTYIKHRCGFWAYNPITQLERLRVSPSMLPAKHNALDRAAASASNRI